MWRHLKLFAIAFALATFAFWTTMLKDPPVTEASNPSVAKFSPRDIKVPVDFPTHHSAGFSPFLEEGLVNEVPGHRHHEAAQDAPAYLRELRAGVD
jgi:hypothetical protein